MSPSAAEPKPTLAVSIGTSALAPALAGIATNPADVAKTRLNMERELQPPNSKGKYSGAVFDCWRRIYHAEGVAGLQRGLSFVLLREASKNSFRIGLFEPLVGVLEPGSSQPAMSTRVVAGAIVGGISAFVCNPLDVLKTRIQLDPSRGAGRTPSEALRQLIAAEGLLSLWRRGVAANVARSSAATSLGLPVNYRLKEYANAAEVPLFQRRPALRDASCALCAALAVAVSINPIDLVRTRLFSQPPSSSAALGVSSAAAPRYEGALDCVRRVAATEGIRGFWKGTWPAFLRIGPHQTLTFVLIGWLQRLIREP
jgi:solute carrier family 25 protein 34/35